MFILFLIIKHFYSADCKNRSLFGEILKIVVLKNIMLK